MNIENDKAENADANEVAPLSGPLYDLFIRGFPEHIFRKSDGHPFDYLDVPKFAKDLEVSRQNVYVYFKKNSVPSRKLKKILALPGCVLTADDLLAFLSEG